MSVQAEEGAGSLFFELAGNLRLSMLMKLILKAYRLSQAGDRTRGYIARSTQKYGAFDRFRPGV